MNKTDAAKETEKLYKDIDIPAVIRELTEEVIETPETISEIAKRQYTLLGDVSILKPEALNTVQIILDIDTTYSPKMTLYSLKTGKISVLKCDKKFFEYLPVEQFDVINIKETEKKKKGKYIDGKWTPLEGQYDFWIKQYTKITF